MGARIDGYVDGSTFSPTVRIKLISPGDQEIELPAIVDTGYNGEVILPENKVQEMGLEFLGTIDSELANGVVVEIELYSGRILWFGHIQEVAIGTTQSDDTLLGTLLLADCKLEIDFRQGWVRVEQLT